MPAVLIGTAWTAYLVDASWDFGMTTKKVFWMTEIKKESIRLTVCGSHKLRKRGKERIMTEVLWSVVLLVIGFVLLIKGADFFVEGSSSVAKRLKVPSIIIGLTIVAMGTSLPECAVSITASITNNNALAVSNAVGSNIFNLMVVCGFCALFNPLAVEKSTLKKEFPFSIICAVLLLVFGYLAMTLGTGQTVCFCLRYLSAS